MPRAFGRGMLYPTQFQALVPDSWENAAGGALTAR
jgi:hypothetical protein